MNHRDASTDYPYHGYLFLAMGDETIILETKEELQELTGNIDFYTDGPTLCAGNVGGKSNSVDIRIVQVSDAAAGL